MTTINNNYGSGNVGATNTNNTEEPINYATGSNTVLAGGISVMSEFMELLTEIANSQYTAMEEQSDICREAQEQSNEVNSWITDMAGEDADATKEITMPNETITYMETNNIYVDGKSVDEFLEDCDPTGGPVYGDPTDPTKVTSYTPYHLTQAEMQEMQGALDNTANTASDFVSENQLQVQKTMQSYNVCVSMINSMQTEMADMNKSIAQNIH